MASVFTYDEFYKAASDSGLLEQFSKADMELAKLYPDAGMSILQYKKDYASATTDEQRAAANSGAEHVRSSYGNYTGGTDGGSYYNNGLSPSSFTYGTAPQYTPSAGSDAYGELADRINSYGSYSYGAQRPEYTDRWRETADSLISDIINRGDFDYSVQEDDLYRQYRKQYLREMDRAAKDALGAAAANTGGIASSYAVGAATQAADYYAAQLTDKIPELYELAYNRYLNDYNMKLSDLSVVQGQEQSEYDKYTDALAQYNSDRAFDYGAWLDGYEMLNNNLSLAAERQLDDWERYLAQLEQYNTDREFAYEQLLDTIAQNNDNRDYAMDFAETAAGYGDYSYIEDLGITPDTVDELEFALTAAKYGDYSYLEALGINRDITNELDFATAAAKYGDYSYLRRLGIVPYSY